LPSGRARRAAGLRREELAELAGVSVDYVVRLEQGRASTPSAQVVNALARAADGYRFTADATDGVTASQPRWVVAQCWQRGDEYAYEPLTDEMTLAEAEEYMAQDGSDPELAALIAQAESTDDFQAREAIIDSLGPLIRAQIRAALPPEPD
jgi:transcriptional regulator with XRE-family HTH domain